MLLKQFVNLILFSVFMLLLTVSIVRADVLVETDSTIYGKVTQITETDVLIARRCNNSDIKTIPKSRVRFYQSDSSCEPHSFTLPTSPLQLCDQEKQKIYKVAFNDEEDEIFATDVRLRADGKFIIFIENFGTLHGSLKKIKSITPAMICPTTIPKDLKIPKETCHESLKVREVNWSSSPVYNNKIFTKSFSFYFEVVGNTKSEVSGLDVSDAFGAALTGWTSTLLDLRLELNSQLSEYLSSILHPGKTVTLLTPPQLVQVDCKENALIIIKLYKERDGRLFPKNGGYVAKSQLEGRTILLNGVDFQYRTDLDTRTLIKDGKINLTTVLAHELGHSFGLPDVDSSIRVNSIMNVESIEKNLSGFPTKEDGLVFVKILEKSITGLRPGEFNPKECSGLKLSSKNKK